MESVNPEYINSSHLFGEPHYIKNAFSVIFPRQLDVRRKANAIENKLAGDYEIPQILPLPDDFEPDAPRIIFNSAKNYSQITISQISIVLTINYSPDWQTNANFRKEYLFERAPLLFNLVNLAKDKGTSIKPHFCGLTTIVQIPSLMEEPETISYISKLLSVDIDAADLHDIQRRVATIKSNKYFDNITIENYRTWQISNPSSDVPKLSRSKATEKGIRITGDFNDRFSFQEKTDYTTNKNEARKIIENGLISIDQIIKQTIGAPL